MLQNLAGVDDVH